MIQKLFGETEAEQLQYLKSRLSALLISLALIALGALVAGVLHLIIGDTGTTIGGVIVTIGSIVLYITLLRFGWVIFRSLFGIASVGVLFSNNVILGTIIFVLYLFVGYLGGLVIAVIGLCRYIVLLKSRKRI